MLTEKNVCIFLDVSKLKLYLQSLPSGKASVIVGTSTSFGTVML